jgi:hypothetical protein
MRLDVPTLDYEDFVRLVFDHPLPADPSGGNAWFWQDEFDWLHWDPRLILRGRLNTSPFCVESLLRILGT